MTRVAGKTGQRNWRAKFVIEWILAAGGLLGLSPVIFLLIILIKITSRGPVFYTAERIGRQGRRFTIYKFRSMKVDAPMILGEDQKVLTIRKDPRLTPIGLFLRLGFDELPQFLNVLRGDMCLIGPRPDVPWEFKRYSDRQMVRLSVLPGITGLAAVTGGRYRSNAWNYEMDVRYVNHSTWRTDIQILLLTIPYALGRERIASNVMKEWLDGLDEVSLTPEKDCLPPSSSEDSQAR